jgi:hypothetical protein
MILINVGSQSKAWLNAVDKRSTPSSDESFPNAITSRRNQIPADLSFHWVGKSVFGGQAVWAWMWAWLSCSEIYECIGHYYNTNSINSVLLNGGSSAIQNWKSFVWGKIKELARELIAPIKRDRLLSHGWFLRTTVTWWIKWNYSW